MVEMTRFCDFEVWWGGCCETDD